MLYSIKIGVLHSENTILCPWADNHEIVTDFLKLVASSRFMCTHDSYFPLEPETRLRISSFDYLEIIGMNDESR